MTEEMREQMTEAEKDGLFYEANIVVNGYSCFQSLAHQLADFICKKNYDEFRLTNEKGFMNATIYLERVVQQGGYFTGTKYAPKQCIGVLIYDIEANKMTLRKTNVNTEIHEFHADEKRKMNDCFGVQYEIFKYLRDGDIIQIHTVERKIRHQKKYIYSITKLKAAQKGRFLHFSGYGTQFFIPKEEFKCIEKELTKEAKKQIKRSKRR